MYWIVMSGHWYIWWQKMEIWRWCSCWWSLTVSYCFWMTTTEWSYIMLYLMIEQHLKHVALWISFMFSSNDFLVKIVTNQQQTSINAHFMISCRWLSLMWEFWYHSHHQVSKMLIKKLVNISFILWQYYFVIV